MRLDTEKRGVRVRKDNKKFVRNIIIISVISLIVLMIILFMALQSYFGKQQKKTYIEVQIQSKQFNESIPLSESRMILVDEINEEQIKGYDIKKNQPFNKKIVSTVKISDAYGKVLPITEIKVGDIVEVGYETDKDSIISISKSQQMESWKKISGVTVDKESRQIKVGGTSYSYTSQTLVLDSQGTGINMDNLGPFDIVSLQCMDQNVWSIVIEEASASIHMVDLPTHNGQIEIDNSRLIQFKDITEPIKVIPGVHKLVIKMAGYETILETLDLGSGEAYELSLEEAEVAYTVVKPYISDNVEDYKIKLGDSIYEPSDEIRLPQGEYEVEITAEGYEKWVRRVCLENEVCTLGARLIAIKEDAEEIEE